MRKQIISKRLAAGLLSLVMLLTLLPAMSMPAAAVETTGFVTGATGTVNGSQSFTANKGTMGDQLYLTIPAMYKGKVQSIQFTASKAVTEWRKTSGDIPEGLTLNESAGTITGTLTESVTGFFTMEAKASDGTTEPFVVQYDCFDESARPTVTTTSLPGGNVGSSYYASLAFEGNYSGWATWEITYGKSAFESAGLTMNANLTMCEITGMPTKTGRIDFGVRVTTISGTSEIRSLSITIDRAKVAPQLSGADLPYAVAGRTYSYDLKTLLTNSGSYYPTTISGWKWYTGTPLPEGLSISDDGILSGTVDASVEPKKYWFTVACTNGLGATSGTLELPVYRVPEINETSTAQPAVKAGESLSWSPLTAGDTMSAALWSATGLPEGVSCGSINGDIYGAPTVAGTYTVTITRYIPNTDDALKATKELTLTVAPDRRFDLDYTSGKYSFPSETVTEGGTSKSENSRRFTVTGKGYSPVDVKVALGGTDASAFALSTTGGTANEDGTLTLSALKKGSDGKTFTVQPVPGLSKGTYEATITVSDTADTANKLERTVSFTVSESKIPISITNAGGLPYAVAGQTYTYQFNATGTKPYAWSLWNSTDYPTPTGMTIDSEGKITWNVPADWTEGQTTFYVSAKPDADPTNSNDYKRAYLDVYHPVALGMKLNGAEYAGTGTTADGRITLPDAYVGTNYKINDYQLMFTATGGGKVKLSLEGMPPAGVTNFGNSGSWSYLTLTPEKPGTYDFTVVAKQYDNSGESFIGEDRKNFRLTVYEPLTTSAGDLEGVALVVGTPLSIDLKPYVSGGKAPYTFASYSDDLPAGLTLDPATGILSGTPENSTNGGISIFLKVTDANGEWKSFSLNRCTFKLPPLELTDPAEGATFIDKISVGLSDAYKAKLSDTATYKLEYRCTYYSNYLVEETTIAGKDATIEIDADKLSSVRVGDAVRLYVRLIETNGSRQLGSTNYGYSVIYTKVAGPTAPTASPYEAVGTNTFVGTTYVRLFATTSGGGVGIRYTTDDTDPTTGGTVYTGSLIPLTATTTIKACCYITTGTGTVYSPVAEFTYTKVEGVTVSGTAVSWDGTDNAEYYLYPATAADATIRAQWKTDGTVSGAVHTGTQGTITNVTVGENAMKSQSFSFGAVAAGEYKLVIFKPGKYVPKIVSVTVGTANVDLGQQKLWLYGDVTYNKDVDGTDAQQIMRYYSGKTSVIGIAAEGDTADILAAANVTFGYGDTDIDGTDAQQIRRFYASKSSVFDTFR